jgi:ABC-type glycerol-3-phosphate transport system substrate-binding protein
VIATGRRLVHLVMALLLVVVSLGCSRTGGPPTVPDPAATKVELKLINFARYPMAALQGVIQTFEQQHPSVKVSAYGPQDRPIPPNQATPFEGIDLLLLTSLQMQEMGRQGLLKELPTVRLPVLEGALPEVVQDLSTEGGRRLGLPVGLSPVLIAANQKGLSSAGISLPSLDWSWADYEQAGTAAVQAGQACQLDGEYLLDSTLRAYGGRVYDADRAGWMLNTPESVQGLAAIARLTKLRAMAIEGPGGPPGNNAFFVVPSSQDTSAGMTLYPLPRGPKGRPTPVNGILASVPTAATHPELAAEFLSLLSTKAAQLPLARAGIRPVTADKEVLAAWRQTVGDRMAQVWELVVNDLYVERTPVYPHDVLSSLAPYFRGETQLDSVISDLIRRTPKH